MSLNKLLEEYVEQRNIIETEYNGMLLQYNMKYKLLNIYTPKGIDVKLFLTIKRRIKFDDPDVLVMVNW